MSASGIEGKLSMMLLCLFELIIVDDEIQPDERTLYADAAVFPRGQDTIYVPSSVRITRQMQTHRFTGDQANLCRIVS